MFDWFFRQKPVVKICTQPIGEIFPWPKDTILTPLDRLVLALPAAMFNSDETIGSLIESEGQVEISIPEDDDKIYLRVPAGATVRLRKSVMSMVLAWSEDETDPKRIKIVTDVRNLL